MSDKLTAKILPKEKLRNSSGFFLRLGDTDIYMALEKDGELYGVFEDDPSKAYRLYSEALSNTVELYPPRLYENMTEYFISAPHGKKFGALQITDRTIKLGVYLSCGNPSNGAIAVFYPGVCEKLYDMFKEDFYILACSNEYVRIIPESSSYSYKGLKILASYANMSINEKSREKILTTSLLKYSHECKKVMACD